MEINEVAELPGIKSSCMKPMNEETIELIEFIKEANIGKIYQLPTTEENKKKIQYALLTAKKKFNNLKFYKRGTSYYFELLKLSTNNTNTSTV